MSRKLTPQEILEIRRVHEAEHLSYEELGKRFNISKVAAWRSVNKNKNITEPLTDADQDAAFDAAMLQGVKAGTQFLATHVIRETWNSLKRGEGFRTHAERSSVLKNLADASCRLPDDGEAVDPVAGGVQIVMTGKPPATAIKCPACEANIWTPEGAPVIFQRDCPGCGKRLEVDLAKANGRCLERREAVRAITAPAD